MSKMKRNRAIRRFALKLATDSGHPSEARSIARTIRRRRLWKNSPPKS